MARLMLSAGMFSALAAVMAPRRRGLPSGSPPPCLAATLISLIRRVNILPRLASSAPFLCLIVAHFEWPDMRNLSAWNDIVAQNTARTGAPTQVSIALRPLFEHPGRRRVVGQFQPAGLKVAHKTADR